MLICIYNNKFLASVAPVVLLVVALPLVSCGRTDSTPKAEAGQAVSPAVGQLSVPLLNEAVPSEGSLPTLIERRHFAIYSNYRVLFDAPPEAFVPGIGMEEERGLSAAVTTGATGEVIAGNLPACSMREMLTQD